MVCRHGLAVMGLLSCACRRGFAVFSLSVAAVRASTVIGALPTSTVCSYFITSSYSRTVSLELKAHKAATVHPKSIVCRLNHFPSKWFVFHQIMKTTQVDRLWCNCTVFHYTFTNTHTITFICFFLLYISLLLFIFTIIVVMFIYVKQKAIKCSTISM